MTRLALILILLVLPAHAGEGGLRAGLSGREQLRPIEGRGSQSCSLPSSPPAVARDAPPQHHREYNQISYLRQVTGVPTTTDGDTLRFGPDRVRLWGIDAPELSDPLGKIAKDMLAIIINNRPVTCVEHGPPSYGRMVAVCTAGGEDLASRMVRNGWAKDWAKYSHGAYLADQKQAEAERRGMWGR